MVLEEGEAGLISEIPHEVVLLAILELALLTVQMTYAKIWNLVILNLISIGGFAVQLMGA